MFNKIAVIPNKSDVSDRALKYAVKFFPDAEFYTIAAVYLPTKSFAASRQYYDYIEKLTMETINHAEEIIKKSDVNVKAEGVEVDTPRDILHYLKKNDIEMLVLPIQERDIHFGLKFHGQDEIFFKKADIPILTINWKASLRKPRSILNPTDGRMHSFMAGETTILLASNLNAKIDRVFIGKSKHLYKKAMGWATEEAEKMKVRMNTDCVVGNFHHASKVIELLVSKRYDLMVMGKGRGLTHGDLLSIVSREIIAMANIPVLVVGN